MNIFEEYLNKILDKIKLASEEKLILLPESLSGINVDIPPKKFKCDLSTNVAMVLSKTNKEPPIKIAEKLKDMAITYHRHTGEADHQDDFEDDGTRYRSHTSVWPEPKGDDVERDPHMLLEM